MDGGSTELHKQWKALPWGFWAKASSTEELLEEAAWKQGMIGQEVRHFLIRLSGPIF